jgi:excinuclease ABC subunit C
MKSGLEKNIDVGQSEFERQLAERLKRIPTKPGVYQYLNSSGRVIYVGKAINLRSRVKSYFQTKGYKDAKTKALIKNIDNIEIIVTDSEAEALILEDTLIKKLKPKYNILLKDDKTYPFVRITNEQYPRIFMTRTVIRDNSKYLGPYTDVTHLKRVLRLVRTLFYLRSCDFNITAESIKMKKHKVCLDYHIKKCEGPCEGLVSLEAYNQGVKSAIQVINGKTLDLEKQLSEEMNRLAENMEFEKAAVMRNHLQLLNAYTESQKIVSVDQIDRDIIGLSRIDDSACSLILKIREGKLVGKRHFIIADTLEKSDEEIIQATLEKWYLENEFIPGEIFLPAMPLQPEFITSLLKSKRGRTIELIVPKLGDKKKLVTMATINAEFTLREYHISMTKKEQTASRTILSLQRDLRLKKPPMRIECFDNSHIQGSDYVSSLVVFVDGKPKKSDYRKFKIKTFEGNDDFAAMREVVSRRYSRLVEENSELPDLIIIDGGKGQLSVAVEILKELKILDKVNVIGLAKRLEEMFFPNQKESVILPRTSSSLRLIQFLRDEAHRFAITYHRKLRSDRTLKTELTEIEGVGQKTANKLLIKFGSVESIRALSIEELSKEAGQKLAEKILNHFLDKNGKSE